MKRLVAFCFIVLLPSLACAQQNQCRTAPVGTSTQYCASEAFVTLTAAAGGDVKGPSSAVSGDVVVFDDATGKLVKDSGIASSTLGTVTEQKNTVGYGLSSSGNCDNTSSNAGSPCNAAVGLTPFSASLIADVLLTPAATFVAGPSVAQGTSGTFLVSGGVTFLDTAAAQTVKCRLWDGTTVIDSRSMTTGAAGFVGSVSLSGKITNPAGNMRISCKSTAGVTTSMLFNQTGDSHDTSITAVRIQ